MHILKVYSIYYILRSNTNVKKIHSDKIGGAKNAVFFLSQALTHYSFNFNLRFSYDLKHKGRLSKAVCNIFHFRFRFVLIKVHIKTS